MSFFEDYVQDGICCETCGELIDGSASGFIRRCPACKEYDRYHDKKTKNKLEIMATKIHPLSTRGRLR